MRALDDFMVDHIDEPADEQRGHFVIETMDQAEWALRKLAKLRARQEQNTRLAEEETRRITEWLGQVNHALAGDIDFFTGLLGRFHHQLLADDPDRKTVDLPAGTLKARKQPDQWDFDGARFVEWAQEHAADLLRVKVEPDKVTAKNRLTAAFPADTDTAIVVDPGTGEEVPGVTVTKGDIKFSVEVRP